MVTPTTETRSLTPKAEALFARFCAIEDANERELFRLAHPVLTSAKVLLALGSTLGASGKARNTAVAARGYAELARFAEAVRQDPRRYPIGTGPLEPLFQRVLRGSLRLDKAVKLAADESMASLLSEEYVTALGHFAARSATQGNWKPALLLCRVLLASARAVEGPEAQDIRLAAERQWLVAAGSILIQIADGDTYRSAKETGNWLFKVAGERKDMGLLAWTHFYLGVLHLDPLTAFGTAENYKVEYEMWLRRGGEELGRKAVEGLPNPRETLEIAVDHMRQAASAAAAAAAAAGPSPAEYAQGTIPSTDIGNLRGMALKALVQALGWLELVGGSVDPDEIGRTALQAIEAIDPIADPARWLLMATQLEKRKVEYPLGPLDRLLSISVDEWVRRSGPHLAAATLTAILVFQRTRDPWEALERSTHAAGLFASRPMENERTEFLQLQLSLFTQAALPRKPVPDQLRTVLENILAGQDDVEKMAAALIALAGETFKANEELLGLEMMAKARQIAPGLAGRHARPLAYQEALLWMGIASNQVNIQPADFDRAVQAYGRALDLFLRENLPNMAREILSRLHNLSLRHHAASAPSMVMILLTQALRAEIAAGDAAASLVRNICRELTVTMVETGGGALLPVIWQVAKGLRWSATLSGGYRAVLAADERVKGILADMDALRRDAPPGSLIDPRPASGTPLFEAWLTSYIRSERFQGDEPWQRMANLKITLDARVQDLLVPAGDPPRSAGAVDGSSPAGVIDWAPWHLPDIQAALDDDTVLLMVYIGVEAGGMPTSYALLITRDDIRAHGRAPALDGTEYQFKDSGRTGEFSAFAVQVQQLRHEIQADPGRSQDGPSVVTPAGQATLSRALAFYFGELESDLDGFRAAGKNHLLVAPHDALHFAPFHLFGNKDGEPLADDWAVTYLPNLALLATPRGHMGRTRRRRWNQAASIGLGFAGSPGGWTEIPEAAQEAVEVARILGVQPILDAHATKAEVLAALSRSNAVHLSTHGAMDVDAPSLQYLVVHPPEDEQAGRVFAHDILDLDLAGVDLVSLSACESALGRVDRADNLRGFPAALFSAGVSTVIGTLWEVNADASVLFFKTFYRTYGGGARRLDAFREAQLETREEFPEFRDWGAFYLAGAWD
jgi:hypothetical protein